MGEANSADLEMLAQRRADLPQFQAEAVAATDTFLRTVIQGNALPYLKDLELFLPRLDELLGAETIQQQDRGWLLTNVMYFLGEYMRQRYGGRWVLDDKPGSAQFGRYVMDVPSGADGSMRVSPGDLAYRYLSAPPGRSIYPLLEPVRRARSMEE